MAVAGSGAVNKCDFNHVYAPEDYTDGYWADIVARTLMFKNARSMSWVCSGQESEDNGEMPERAFTARSGPDSKKLKSMSLATNALGDTVSRPDPKPEFLSAIAESQGPSLKPSFRTPHKP